MRDRLNISRLARVAGLSRAVVTRFLAGEPVTATTANLCMQALDTLGWACIDPDGRERDDDRHLPIYDSEQRDRAQANLAARYADEETA